MLTHVIIDKAEAGPQRALLMPCAQELSAAAAAAAADYESRLKQAAAALGLQTAGGFPR
jgi:hypothetical protein